MCGLECGKCFAILSFFLSSTNAYMHAENETHRSFFGLMGERGEGAGSRIHWLEFNKKKKKTAINIKTTMKEKKNNNIHSPNSITFCFSII